MLGLPWAGKKRMAESDAMVILALATHQAGMCPCGCGHHTAVAHDPETEDSWEGRVVHCYAGKAKDEFEKQLGDKDPGALIVMELPSARELRESTERRRRKNRRVVR